MNIKIVIQYNPFFQNSATGNRWQSLLTGLAIQGVQIELLIYGGFQSKDESILALKLENINFNYIQSNLITGYWQKRIYTYISSYYYQAISQGRILRLIKKDDIVWTDVSSFSFALVSKLKKYMPKTVSFIEMSEFLDIHKYNKGNVLQRMQAEYRQKKFESVSYYKYDGIALMTRTLLAHYQRFPSPHPKFLHLPMTVDSERFNGNHDQLPGFQKPYIAFVGVMDDAKDGVSILIRAFNSIQNEFPDYNLYLIGGWNYDTPLHQQLIKELKLENKVFWKGEFSRDQIPAIIMNVDLLALPRPDSKQAQGGFPTKLGEYLASGNPVCATRVGEIPDYLSDGESVFFADPSSVESFANAMHRALSDPAAAKVIGANGRKVAETYFNKDIQAKILYDFLLKLANEKKTQ